jgi:hypothetical protein
VSANDNTGQGLVEFCEYAASKGLLNRETAGSLRTASARILGIDEGWESTDLTKLDVEALLQRFETLHKGDFTPQSLAVYKSRFRKALNLYQTYLSNPSGFRPQVRPSRKPSERKDAPERKEPPENKPKAPDSGPPAPPPPGNSPPVVNVVDYPFPLRQGVIVHLMLPPDLRRAEAKRLGAFIDALAMDDALPRALPAPEKANASTESSS